MILALDLSSTSTGVCFDGDTFTIAPPASWPLLKRAREMREEIKHYLIPAPDLVVIEGIGTRHVQTAIAIATVHALVLDEVVGYCPLLVVQPTALKKWATGKGSGKQTDKVGMALAAQRNGWQPSETSGDDEADAWWLWTLGRAIGGVWDVPQTAYRTEVLETLEVTP